jgi:hypothetical protein
MSSPAHGSSTRSPERDRDEPLPIDSISSPGNVSPLVAAAGAGMFNPLEASASHEDDEVGRDRAKF